jgi:hypothetical protein
MKHYLLTWYGITDLRAALGLESTDGPILSALKTGQFTDVVILAYTNPGKDKSAFSGDLYAKWKKWREEDIDARLKIPREKSQQFVDAVSNTVTGHSIFGEWLKAELAIAAVSCNIEIIPKELKKLNDAQGIYAAAVSALKRAMDDVTDKTVTCFISPGTPVMAYTWALIARSHPHLKIDVIASSEPRNPPEKIDLPKDVIMPVVSTVQTTLPSGFDVIIHLLGRERMPIYFGMLQFRAKKHIFITTQDFADAARILARLLPRTCENTIVTIPSPFLPSDTRKAIEKQISKLTPDATVSVNLTGGTKLMFAGALSACWELGLEPFYFEINHHNIIFVRTGQTIPFIGTKSIVDIFAVNGFAVITQGLWEDRPCRRSRISATKAMWEERQTLGELYRLESFRKYKVPWGVKRNPPFDWRWGNSDAAFNISGEATLFLNDRELMIDNCDDFGTYLGGGWLEEYVFLLLRNLEEKGIIYDLRIGVEVDYLDKPRGTNDAPSGEFDCAFTDGKRLWLVECKAGSVKQEHIQKLENNLKTHGGIAARGLLVSSFPLFHSHAKRISSSTSIRAVCPNELSTEFLQKILMS